jgi:hypothetical protein
VESIQYHHDFAAAPRFRRLAAIASLADSMMVVLEVGFRKDKSLNLEDEASARFLNLTAPVLQKVTGEVQAAFSTVSRHAHS